MLWVEGVWLPFGRLAAELNVRPCGSRSCPWMSQCTYCKDLYVGLVCLRVIYLPTDHDATLEISGEIYLKYVAFCLSLFIKATDQHRKVFVFTSAI